LQGLRDLGKLHAGQGVLVVGASGGVGTFAVQIAKAQGAAAVTGICSTRNVEMVRSIGTDHVIDYTQEDFTSGKQRYDLIFQLAGTSSPSECRRALTARGLSYSAARMVASPDRSHAHCSGVVTARQPEAA
jgi:NADPH:quinone reductase-like Zn-dependent oxidoreductase